MNKKNIIGIIIVILIIVIGISIYFVLSNKSNENDKTVSDIHDHSYTEATCENPRTCTICGKTDGDVLPHTTNIGKCENCGKLQNEELSKTIINNISSISENTTNCNDIVQSANIDSAIDCFNKFLDVSDKIKNNNEYLEKIIELCGDYEELKNIKGNCINLLSLEVNINGSDTNSLTDFLQKFQSYLLTASKLFENVSELANLYV